MVATALWARAAAGVRCCVSSGNRGKISVFVLVGSSFHFFIVQMSLIAAVW